MDSRHTVRRRRLLPRRALAQQLISLGRLLAHVLVAYSAVTAAAAAVFSWSAVASGSMEPAFQRGDVLLFRRSLGDPVRAGDVVMFEPEIPTAYYGGGAVVPVVHRVIEVHERRGGGGGRADILTKGDDNGVDDSAFLYTGPWLHREHVMGRAVGYLPKAGLLSLAAGDMPGVRTVVLGVLLVVGLATALF